MFAVKLMPNTFESKVTTSVVSMVRQTVFRWCGFEVIGEEKIPTQPFLLVARHTSYLDGIVLGAYFYKHMRLSPIAARGLFRFPASVILNGAGAIPIKRGQPYHKGAVQLALKRLTQNAVLIFPEGGLRLPDRKAELKTGYAYLAAKSQAPIVLVHLENAHLALRPGSFLLRRQKLVLRVISVLHPGDSGYPMSVKKAAREWHARFVVEELGF